MDSESSEHKRYLDGVFITEINNLKDLINNLNENMRIFEKRIESLQMRVYYIFGIASALIIGFEIFLRIWWK